MDKSQEKSFDRSATNNSSLNEPNIATSTPMMRSEMGQQLIRRHFIKNLPEDISLPINIEETPPPTKPLHPFIFRKEVSDSDNYKFKTPTAISPETMEKFRRLFGTSPKPTRKRLRL